MRRRDFVSTLAGGIAGGLAATQLPMFGQGQNPTPPPAPGAKKGKFRQGVMRQNFPQGMQLEQICQIASKVGIKGVDMAGNNDLALLKKYGMTISMGGTGGVDFNNGLIRKEVHDQLVKSVSEQIDFCAANGIANFISVGGQRKGMSNEEGWENAALLLKRLKPRLEDKNVTMCIEIMNSKYDDSAIGRKDQICDHISWGVELAKRAGTPRFKVLCDIYHLQIMDGNVIENIRNNYQYIAHFHTGGVPGRREIDDSQEINYPAVARAIADLGFDGFITHEYRLTPGKDAEKELARAFAIMDV
jgi:hydroxypyruvate isomerase